MQRRQMYERAQDRWPFLVTPEHFVCTKGFPAEVHMAVASMTSCWIGPILTTC